MSALREFMTYLRSEAGGLALLGKKGEERGEPWPEKADPEQSEADQSKGGESGPPPITATGPLGLSFPVGRGAKNIPEDVLTVQKALNKRFNAGLSESGKYDAKTQQAIEEFQIRLGQFKPSGLIEPGRGVARALASSAKLGPPAEPPKPMAPPKLGKPSLATAPVVWRGTRELLATNIQELKKAVLGHYGNDSPKLLTAIEAELKNLSGILDKLDHRLADSLELANAAADDAARREELNNAKTILAGYIEYVKSEPMIAHIDANPFGVDTRLKVALMESLTHMAKSMK